MGVLGYFWVVNGCFGWFIDGFRCFMVVLGLFIGGFGLFLALFF